MQRQEGARLDFTRVTNGEKLSGNLRDTIEAAMKLKEEKRPESVRMWLEKSLGFEADEATGLVSRPSQEELSYRETELKVLAQKLGIAVLVLTALFGAVRWGMKEFRNTQPTNESPAQVQEEVK